jgi:SPP1 gp7 family putative phage head morphogenesis protein
MAELRPLPPEEAIAFFGAKGYRIGWDWRDVFQQEHDHAFTVAKAMEVDVLATIRAAVEEAIAEGTTLAEFRERLEPELRRLGWWGRQPSTDPATGETRLAQLGSPRRLQIIFDTNLRTAYSAGQWDRIKRTAARRPWLRYVAVRDERTREDHRRWHGTVLPYDHPWWRTHFPPNGWRCRCSVQQLSEAELGRYGYAVSDAPETRTRAWRNPRTGKVVQVPEGIDPGFAYHPGRSRSGGLD